MAGIITRGNHPKAHWPGVHAWFGHAYNEHPQEWNACFKILKSKKSREEEVELTGFGLAPVKTEGGAIRYDSMAQGTVATYRHIVYGLGYIVTEEEREDNLYPVVSKQRATALAFSMRQTKETVHANIFNRAFNPAYGGADGKSLLATDHPTLSGDQSNKLATPADLSEAALEDALVQIMQMRNSKGLKISMLGDTLLIPAALAFEAERILKTKLRTGTDQNDINAIKSMGLLPNGFAVNHYLTDDDAWFIKTNAPNGLQHFSRRGLKFAKDNDFDTSNAKAKATERYSVGWTDWRGLFGSEGTA